jgi:hypothetical protein
LAKKNELVSQIRLINDKLAEYDSSKSWEKATEQVIKTQNDWKLIGQAPRKENDDVWKEFRAACDVFFESKKEFFKVIEAKQKEVVDKKRKLIDQAKSIQESTDWKGTSEKLIRLQKEWKNSGNAGQRFENKLWAEFRAACDVFFNAREENLKEQQSALVVNADLKKQLIDKISQLELTGDKKADLTTLKELNDEFKAIGNVPNEQRDEINQLFRKGMDSQYEKLNIDSNEKELILFKSRFDTVPSGSNRMDFIQKERSTLRKQIDQLNAEAIQMETNLSFFSRSKGADNLRKEVDQKVGVIQQKIEVLKRKLKAIPSE